MPIYNVQNQVIGMERPVDPVQLEGLQKDTHLGRMLGVWMGRIQAFLRPRTPLTAKDA